MTRSRMMALTLLLGLGPVSYAPAVTFNFNGNGGPFDSNAATAAASRNGIDITLAANAGGVVSGNASGLGVNSPTSADEPSQIDGDVVTETLAATFGQNVFANFFLVSSLGAGDQGSSAIAAGAPVGFTASGLQTLGGATLAAGDAVTFAHVAGNGYALNALNVTLSPLATFDLLSAGIEAIDETATLLLPAVQGITPTLTTLDGVFNLASGTFGINATPTGDNTSQIDGSAIHPTSGQNILESLDLSFDTNVYLEFLRLSSFSSTDSLLFTYADGSTRSFTGADLLPGNILDIGSPAALVGEKFSIQFAAGNGLSFDAFGVSQIPTPPTPPSQAVPEPTSAALLTLAAAALTRRRRQA